MTRNLWVPWKTLGVPPISYLGMNVPLTFNKGIATLDCWIVQSGFQSSLADWIIAIDNPKL